MSGPIGVMSVKFVLAAGALLLSARIDMHAVSAILDPSTPVSTVTPELARRIGAGEGAGPVRAVPRHRVVGMDHSEMRLRSVAVANLDRGGELVVGADLLREMALALDFRKDRLRVLDKQDYRHLTARMVPIPATSTPDGCVSITGTGADGAPVRAAIDGQSPAAGTGQAASIGLGPVVLKGWRIAGRCASSDMVLDWSAFAGQTLILDLGRGRIWLPANAW